MWQRFRKLAMLFQSLLILGIPFIKINGESAFRFDLVNFKLHFFGSVIWMEEFYLFLIASIFILMLIVLFTVALGRVWCGWLCPQTVFLYISAIVAGWFTRSKKKKSIIENFILLIISAVASLSLIWYFVPPLETMKNLFSNNVILGFFIVDWVIIYAELAYLGRKFCRTVCPYSMLQNAIFDKDTVVVAYDKSRDKECGQCDLCVKVCTVGIKIKDGLKKECVACAECIDACVSMTKPKNILPLIGYKGKVRRTKIYILSGITALFFAILVVLSMLTSEVDFLITRDYKQPHKSLNVYSYSVTNSKSSPIDFIISVQKPFIIIGDSNIDVPPYSKKRGAIRVALTKPKDKPDKVIFALKNRNNILYKKRSSYK